MSNREILLPCQLSDDEIRAKGQELAEQIAKLEDLRDEKKQAGSKFTKAIKDTESACRGLGKAIAARSEERLTEVEHRPNTETWEIETWRLDTAELVDTRGMSYEERQKHGQVELPLDEGVAEGEEEEEEDEADKPTTTRTRRKGPELAAVEVG